MVANLSAIPAGTGSTYLPKSAADSPRAENTENANGRTEKTSNDIGENQTLTADEQRQLEKLKARDTEVRAHEQAHLSAAGGIAISGASFSYQTGPDGRRYAIGGEVRIDTSPVPGDPEATIRKAETIRRAALAPAQPSSQDYRVASKATEMANDARIELLRQTQQGVGENKGMTIDTRA